VRFEADKSERKSDDGVSTAAGDEAERLVEVGYPQSYEAASPSPLPDYDPAQEPMHVVNMPTVRNLDAWHFAEHMEMSVLLQVGRVASVLSLSLSLSGAKDHGGQGWKNHDLKKIKKIGFFLY